MRACLFLVSFILLLIITIIISNYYYVITIIYHILFLQRCLLWCELMKRFNALTNMVKLKHIHVDNRILYKLSGFGETR